MQYIDFPDLARVTRMVYDAAMALANLPARPALDAPKQRDPRAACKQLRARAAFTVYVGTAATVG